MYQKGYDVVKIVTALINAPPKRFSSVVSNQQHGYNLDQSTALKLPTGSIKHCCTFFVRIFLSIFQKQLVKEGCCKISHNSNRCIPTKVFHPWSRKCSAAIIQINLTSLRCQIFILYTSEVCRLRIHHRFCRRCLISNPKLVLNSSLKRVVFYFHNISK